MVATWGPWSIPKRDPKLTGFIWYVKLHGKHCSNSLLPVSDGIIRVSPVLSWLPNRWGEGLGFFYFLVSQLTPCEKKKKKVPCRNIPCGIFPLCPSPVLPGVPFYTSRPHPIILAWRIPERKEPGGLQSMGSLRVLHN